jgi:hypothetical protein
VVVKQVFRSRSWFDNSKCKFSSKHLVACRHQFRFSLGSRLVNAIEATCAWCCKIIKSAISEFGYLKETILTSFYATHKWRCLYNIVKLCQTIHVIYTKVAYLWKIKNIENHVPCVLSKSTSFRVSYFDSLSIVNLETKLEPQKSLFGPWSCRYVYVQDIYIGISTNIDRQLVCLRNLLQLADQDQKDEKTHKRKIAFSVCIWFLWLTSNSVIMHFPHILSY